MTLLELLMVMTIIGIVFGLGVRAFSGMDLGRGADADLLRGALRATRAAALAERHPASLAVITDQETKRESLVVHRMQTLGTWHFERNDGRGTEDLTAAPVGGARQIDDGHIGRGLGFFRAGREARAVIALDTVPTFDLSAGLSLEVFVRLEGSNGGTILRLGTNPAIAGLETGDGGSLRGWVAPTYFDATGRQLVGGRVDLDLPRGTLIVGRWTRIVLSYDRVLVRLVVDDFLAGVRAADGPLAPLEGGLTLGGAPVPFEGSIDSLVVRAVVASDPLPMSSTLVWPEGAPRRVLFDADGSLDTVLHGGNPFSIVLPTDPDDVVEISRLGVIE